MMISPRGCEFVACFRTFLQLNCSSADVFIGLNIVRALSIIALLLVFASSIYTMVQDVEAVNRFIDEGRTTSNSTEFDLVNHDYIECVNLYGQTMNSALISVLQG
jgi:hypothetical protein